jgi:hypothetical protein
MTLSQIDHNALPANTFGIASFRMPKKVYANYWYTDEYSF